jgi:uncharacterized protein with ParB-like and HNH nuclease domain
MRDYPIGAFLFWKVEKEKVNDYEFYEFLRNYHEKKNRHNPKANVKGDESITAILDGQQRLTSLYVGLKGSYAYKLPRKRWDNDEAFPERQLYLNLLRSAEDPELEFEFRFLTNPEKKPKDEAHYWFPISEILNLKEPHEINEYLIKKGLFTDFGKEKASFANRALSKLHNITHIKPTISYYLEKSPQLDKVLNIFIRINSAGTELSYSDLLLSIATAQWEEKDAREEIINFVDEINNIGEGFNFNKDFVLKSCLIISDFTDIAFKVDNFNKSNMLTIENNWEEITKAIKLAVNLVASFGYNRDTLSSNNALIPIAYHLKKIGLPDNFAKSTYTIQERKIIRKWLLHSLMKRAFSGQPDNVLRPIRKMIQESNSSFPLQDIINHFKGTNKSLIFSEADVENLLYAKYGQGFLFSLLAMLYPSFDFKNIFHVDHIHPKSLFTRTKLKKFGVSEADVETYLYYHNYIGNLQLLEDIPNIEKQDKHFEDWFYQTLKTKEERSRYRELHSIPDVDLSFDNFIKFFETRKEMIQEKLRKAFIEEVPDIGDRIQEFGKSIVTKKIDRSIISSGSNVAPNVDTAKKVSAKQEGLKIRSSWVQKMASIGVNLNGHGKRYITAHGKSIGIASANELNKPHLSDKWFLGLKDERADIVVLLCRDSNKNVHDLVLPVAELGPTWSKLSRSRGEIKFHVQKQNGDFQLLIPGDNPITVSSYNGNYQLLSH